VRRAQDFSLRRNLSISVIPEAAKRLSGIHCLFKRIEKRWMPACAAWRWFLLGMTIVNGPGRGPLATSRKGPMPLKNSFLRRVQKVFWPVRCVEGLARRGIAPKAKVFRTASSAKLRVGIAANMDAEGIQREFIVSAIYEFFNNIDPFRHMEFSARRRAASCAFGRTSSGRANTLAICS
jgi:hypothetical protein